MTFYIIICLIFFYEKITVNLATLQCIQQKNDDSVKHESHTTQCRLNTVRALKQTDESALWVEKHLRLTHYHNGKTYKQPSFPVKICFSDHANIKNSTFINYSKLNYFNCNRPESMLSLSL